MTSSGITLIVRYLITTLLLTIPGYSMAAESEVKNWYQVELILFKQPQPVITPSEQWDGWDKRRTPINFDESIELHYPRSTNAATNAIEENMPLAGSGTVSLQESEAITASSLQPQSAAEAQIAPPQPFTFTPITNWELGRVYEKLNSSGQYEPLLHTAWIQPGLDREQAIAIHLHDHMTLVTESSATVADSNNPAVEPPSAVTNAAIGAEVAASGGAIAYPLESSFFAEDYQLRSGQQTAEPQMDLRQITFNGLAKVILSRYLHFEINLDYAPLGFPQEIGNTASEIVSGDGQTYAISGSSISSTLQDGEEKHPLFYESSHLNNVLQNEERSQKVVYRIAESRRMRSRELHYIDHPKLGVLIKITPVEVPKMNQEVTTN
jgi:hypothetical protein